jgi:L-threonylcarbamoyladenylate synthase
MPVCSNSVPAPELDRIAEAARVLATGGAVVYPTETVYGLGVDAFDAAALERLAALKVRFGRQPISVLIGDVAMLRQIAEDIPAAAATLMARFWPGPLTLVLSARPGLSAVLTAASGSIGVRLSSHPIARALVRRFGRPITAPSANPAGRPPATTIDMARGYFADRVDLYLDGGRLPGEPASTVVDVRAEMRVIRAGAVPVEALRAALQAEE